MKLISKGKKVPEETIQASLSARRLLWEEKFNNADDSLKKLMLRAREKNLKAKKRKMLTQDKDNDRTYKNTKSNCT